MTQKELNFKIELIDRHSELDTSSDMITTGINTIVDQAERMNFLNSAEKIQLRLHADTVINRIGGKPRLHAFMPLV